MIIAGGQFFKIAASHFVDVSEAETRIFVRGHYLFREANSFPRAKLEENCELRYEEQMMSKDKYPSIFSPQMEAIVFIVNTFVLGPS